jgi:hypothetical protein
MPYHNHVAPGDGSTHVPFGQSVAASVKSPATPWLVNCQVNVQPDQMKTNKMHTASLKKCGNPLCNADRE